MTYTLNVYFLIPEIYGGKYYVDAFLIFIFEFTLCVFLHSRYNMVIRRKNYKHVNSLYCNIFSDTRPLLFVGLFVEGSVKV